MDDAPRLTDTSDRADFEAFVAGQITDRREPERSELEQYLRDHPGQSVRDWKAKPLPCPVPVAIGERAWSALDASDVRAAATRHIARELPRSVRQAAGRDPGLVWNRLASKYRMRVPTDAKPEAENPPA